MTEASARAPACAGLGVRKRQANERTGQLEPHTLLAVTEVPGPPREGHAGLSGRPRLALGPWARHPPSPGPWFPLWRGWVIERPQGSIYWEAAVHDGTEGWGQQPGAVGPDVHQAFPSPGPLKAMSQPNFPFGQINLERMTVQGRHPSVWDPAHSHCHAWTGQGGSCGPRPWSDSSSQTSWAGLPGLRLRDLWMPSCPTGTATNGSGITAPARSFQESLQATELLPQAPFLGHEPQNERI